MSIPINQQILYYNGKEIQNGSLLTNGLLSNCELELKLTLKRDRKICIADIPSTATPEELLRYIEQYPYLLIQYKNVDIELGEILESKDIGKLRTIMMKRYMSNHKKHYEHQQEIKKLENDPMNIDNQKKIEEMIRLETINVKILYKK